MRDEMHIETERLTITEFDESMAEAVHENSLDEDNRRFDPDEVFETVEEAADSIRYLMSRYDGYAGPYVYPVILKTGENIGYVQTIPFEDGWEIGYHIAKKYTGHGYATEAVKAFMPVIMKRLNINMLYGICLFENKASIAVLKKCGFKLKYKGPGNYQGKTRDICRYLFFR